MIIGCLVTTDWNNGRKAHSKMELSCARQQGKKPCGLAVDDVFVSNAVLKA